MPSYRSHAAALELARRYLGALARDEPFGVVRERQLTGFLRAGQGGCAAEGVPGGVQLVRGGPRLTSRVGYAFLAGAHARPGIGRLSSRPSAGSRQQTS